MKTKRLIFALIGIGIGIVCFIIGWWTREVQCKNTILYDYAVKIDSLKQLEFIREDDQLPYYGMKRKEVLEILPLPQGDYTIILFDGDTLMNLFWLYNPYKERLKGTQDTIIVSTYSWEIPYHDRPDLFIVFEKKGEEWVATRCVQWDSERVFID
jgi:hypothetical protein